MPRARSLPLRALLLELNPGLIQKFKNLAQINVDGFHENECWLWKNSHQTYPKIRLLLETGKETEIVSVSRVSCVIQSGELDPELEVDHRCYVSRCVNPTHLLPCIPARNIASAVWYRKMSIKFGFRLPVYIGHQRLHETWELPEYNEAMERRRAQELQLLREE